jgi:hypothetical protein
VKGEGPDLAWYTDERITAGRTDFHYRRHRRLRGYVVESPVQELRKIQLVCRHRRSRSQFRVKRAGRGRRAWEGPLAPWSTELTFATQFNAGKLETGVVRKRIVVFQSRRDRKMLIDDFVSTESATVLSFRTLLVGLMSLILRRAKVSFHSLSSGRVSRWSRLHRQ